MEKRGTEINQRNLRNVTRVYVQCVALKRGDSKWFGGATFVSKHKVFGTKR
jgi:hypothetical protein